MPIRTAYALWEGTSRDGRGKMSLGSRAYEGAYSFASRFEEGPGTNPEELIGAAHAGCFSMALAGELNKAGYKPASIRTSAKVSVEKVDGGFEITKSELHCEAEVPDIDDETFQKHAEAAKKGCPVSKALAGVQITLDAKLLQPVRG
ncbi:MAG: OsmC family protein [Armatimonadota bacterium]